MRLKELDQYLANISPLVRRSARLLLFDNLNQGDQKGERPERPLQPPQHRLITSTNSGRVINILQGEIAHCTPSQADVLVSDDATTCHIVALWSRYVGSKSEQGGKTDELTGTSVLATMAHIDGTEYSVALRDGVDQHVKHHFPLALGDGEEREDIEMCVHVMGGFSDQGGSSIEITDSILRTFAALSDVYSCHSVSRGVPRICMTLQTCAVASANDDGTGCPLGRGMAMEVATGRVFLAEVEGEDIFCNGTGVSAVDSGESNHTSSGGSGNGSALGPEVTLRSARLWAAAFHQRHQEKGKLHTIHRPDQEYLSIDPFFFGPHRAIKGLLHYNDEELLHLTSTSPEVEKSNFVSHVRQSLSYMSRNTSSEVFMDERALKYTRVGLNGWHRLAD